jgi:LCP family protein required for cell wall assembly
MRSGSGALGLAVTGAEADLLLDEPIILDDLPVSKAKKRWPFGWLSNWGLKRSALTLLALIIAGGLFMGLKFYITQRHLFRGGGGAPALASNIDISKLRGEGDGRINILLLGNGGPEHQDGPDLTDTIMIASIDPVNNKVALLSIPRDLWVKIPADGSRKINEAYYYGKLNSKSKDSATKSADGVDWVDKTLEPLLGIPIHYHAVVDFAAFRQTVDAVGGIDVNVPKELSVKDFLWDEGMHRNYSLNVLAGQQHFDGTRALLYARSRYTSPRGDFDRSERQRLMITALKEKIFNVGTFSNPVKVSNLLSGLGSNIYTDFSRDDITRLYQVMGKIPASNIVSIDLVTPPHDFLTTGNLGGISIVQPKAGLSAYGDIQNYVRNALRDSFLAKENASVAIYNATSVAGLATKESTLLKSYGYNVTTVDSLPKATDPAKSTLVDLSGGAAKYTRHYLEQRLGVTAQNSLPAGLGVTPPSGTKFVIIAGKDVNGTTR